MDDGDLKHFVCSDTDFQTVIRMAKVIVRHTRSVSRIFRFGFDAKMGEQSLQIACLRKYFENLPSNLIGKPICHGFADEYQTQDGR